MDGYDVDVRDLLRNIDDSYGDGPDLPILPFSRPTSNPFRPQTDRSQGTRHTSAEICYQQPLYETRTPRPLEAYHHLAQNDAVLDDCDRAILAKPHPQSQWHSSSRTGTLGTGRLSLPGHTAPYTPTPFVEASQLQRPPPKKSMPSTKDFRASMAQYISTPLKKQTASSSPINGLPSSPSFGVYQRRSNHESALTAPKPESSFPSHSHSACFRPNAFPNVSKPRTNSYSHSIHLGKGQLRSEPLSMSSSPRQPAQLNLDHAPPMVQGIQLVSLNELPDCFRSVFPFPLFNAIQSKCYPTAYQSNDNLVVSAPTGGGKTAILEMAICRLVSTFNSDQYKIVYMAPTKSLCSERQRDWQGKFASLDLQCAELTGDTDNAHLRNVQSANVVITTPEKWDSMTRKWKDHAKLMQTVKLFLIDEVHILKDTRGATLEAVVSRMKSVGSNVRFVALSATVPNSDDIATWLGKDATNQELPAPRERFGEEFRPVKLKKHVVGLPYGGNEFGFERVCDPKLPDIIAKFSHKKPMMIFCITRKATVMTAKLLANVWATKTARDRYWAGPTRIISVDDTELRNTLSSGVAFHHAGLDGRDRQAVEKGFLEGQINVICCTSTLAVGVNLPCHLVIIKNTVSYQDDGLKEYADLEIMQMLGRAGRPQFDDNAVAVIITKQEKVKKYEKLVSGEELLESCLHLNLIDHLNAEIGLGTIHDLYTAKRWLAGTFLYVRLRQNPNHYKLDGDATDQNLDERIEGICKRDLGLLEDAGLISSADKLKSTEFGDAMARYYVKFETMQVFLSLAPRSKMSDILSAIVQAAEYHEIRLRAGEKKLYKELNRGNGIKFPIRVDVAMHAHKRSLIIQSELGGVDFPADEQYTKHRKQFQQDKAMLLSNIHRLVRCVIDCQIYLQDGVAVRNALELARSFGARVWDNSPYQMKQIAQIGLVAIRKLVIGGINNIEALEAAEAHRIELLMSKNPPFGNKLLASLKEFPKLRVSVKMMGKESNKGRPVTVKIKAECGFMNEAVPTMFHRKPIYICLLTERSDGFLVDFRRIRYLPQVEIVDSVLKKTSARNLGNGQDMLMSAEMVSHSQYFTTYVMCDEIAGTMRYAELKPDLPAYLFPPQPMQAQGQQQGEKILSCANAKDQQYSTSPLTLRDDEFGDDDIDDQDMANAAEGLDFNHVDEFDTSPRPSTKGRSTVEQSDWNPERLENRKWACNHRCKDKKTCKHMCCREGVDRAPKPPKSFVPASSMVDPLRMTQGSMNRLLPVRKTPLTNKATKKGLASDIEELDLAGPRGPSEISKSRPREFQRLQQLDEKVRMGRFTPVLPRRKPSLDCGKGEQLKLCFPNTVKATDYEDDWMNDFAAPSTSQAQVKQAVESFSEEGPNGHKNILTNESPRLSNFRGQNEVQTETSLDSNALGNIDLSQFSNEISDVEVAMIGLSDSVTMKEDSENRAANDYSTASHERENANDESCLETASSPKLFGPSKIQAERSRRVNDTSKHQRLGLSTDSPEYPSTVAEKRTADASVAAEGSSQQDPAPKRQKLSDHGEQFLRPTPSAEIKAAVTPLVIKPGQPAWVYDFDPAFIAEYQDIVDFV